MSNFHRGEITAELGGKKRNLRLTLGALAELESELGEGDILSLLARFEESRMRTSDCIAVLRAGLRGAGETVEPGELEALGPEAFGVVVRLLQASFGNA
jgi:hypothetical protein